MSKRIEIDIDDDKGGKKMKYSDDEQDEEEEDKKDREISKEENVSSSSTPTECATDHTEEMVVEPSGSGGEHMDVQQQEKEEDKEKEASKEGNASSSSTPMEIATDAEALASSAQMILRLFGDENVVLPLKKRRIFPTTQGHDQETHYHVISELKPGDSSDRASPEPEGKPGIVDCEEEESSYSDSDEEWQPGETLLFEMELTPSNRLVIPAELAADYFPAMKIRGGYEREENLQLTDYQGDEWYLTIIYYPVEEAFLVTKGWQQFVTSYNLQPTNLIRFLRPLPRLHTNHFNIEFDRGEDQEGAGNRTSVPEFRPENFLFQIRLTGADTGYFRLYVPLEEVTNHFPEITTTKANDKQMILRFTDVGGKDWYMNIYYNCSDACMVVDGWDEYVVEHNLESEGVIRFYKPVQPLHANHFLIGYVKKGGEGDREQTNPRTQPGSAKNDGNGGCGGTNTGSENKKGNGGGRSRKGKEFACW